MIFDLIHFESQIENIVFQLQSANDSVVFWRTQENELREEYKDSTQPWDLDHLAKIEKYRQDAEAKMMEWQNEFSILQGKLDAWHSKLNLWQDKLNFYKVIM